MTGLPEGLIADYGGDLHTRTACVLNPGRTYRYLLSYTWNEDVPPLVWIMLNPSVADAHRSDPTLHRCLAHARRREAGGIVVANLFALISTNPARLTTHPDPVGPLNDLVLTTLLPPDPWLVMAWGAHPFAEQRAAAVAQLFSGIPLWCLGTTQNGAPRHPGRLAYSTPMEPYIPPRPSGPVV